MEYDICVETSPSTPHKWYSRIDSTDEITSVFSLTDEIQKPKFSHYLCFVVSVKTNLFVYKQNEKYSSQQEEMFKLIKSLQEKGLGYRKISLPKEEISG